MTSRNPEIFGQGLPPEAMKAAEEFIAQKHLAAQEKVPGEIEHPPEMDAYIEFLNTTLARECQELQIAGDPPRIEKAQIHLLSAEAYREDARKRWELSEENAETIAGISNTYEATMTLNNELLQENRATFYHMLTHEAIHLASVAKIRAQIEPEKTVKIGLYRTGYNVVSPNRDPENDDFRWLNEVVVEKMAMEIKEKNWDTIDTILHLPPNTERRYTYAYAPVMGLVEKILGRVAGHSHVSPSELWANMKRGLLTGGMMHLRTIEKAYGPGSLRALAALGRGTYVNAEETKRLTAQVEKFFSTDDETERTAALSEILKNEKPSRQGRAKRRTS